MLGSLDVAAVIDAVCEFYKVDRDYILTKNSRNNEARQVLLYLSCKFCRGKYSLSKLGEHLGALTVGSLTSGRYKMAAKINFDAFNKNHIKVKNENGDYRWISK